jgi:predicted phage replisome organizer
MDWVKIMCNILDHRKIKMIRKGPEGNTLVLLWLLMLTEAGKCDRGGYLMVSDSLAYTAETLSMVMDIPLPTVQLGLRTFSGLDMIDQHDGVIYVRNWGKYQSEDKLGARREKDRERKQRQRQKEREKLLALSSPAGVSRDGHNRLSRDVTLENRTDKSRREKTTTEAIRLLLCGTPLDAVSDRELQALAGRHGLEQLTQVADIAAETWRRDRGEIGNPGGYLQSLCSSLVVPAWYEPPAKRQARVLAARQKKVDDLRALEVERQDAEKEVQVREAYWSSLSTADREEYLATVKAATHHSFQLPEVAVVATAKTLAWEKRSQMNTK